MKHETKAAREIAEHLLQITGNALKQGDFEAFSSCFVLPHNVDTFEGSRTISTIEEMREIFNYTRRYFDAHNITEMVRTCVEAEFRDADTISTTHISRVLSGEKLVHGPYAVFKILIRTDAGWKISDGQYAAQESAGHLRALTQKTSADTKDQETQLV